MVARSGLELEYAVRAHRGRNVAGVAWRGIDAVIGENSMRTQFGELPDDAPTNNNPKLSGAEVSSICADRKRLMGMLALGGANSHALGILWRNIRIIDERLNNLPPMRRYG